MRRYKTHLRYALLLLIITMTLTAGAALAAGQHSIPFLDPIRLGRIALMAMLYGLGLIVATFIKSMKNVRSFVDEENGKVDIRALHRAHGVAMWPAILMFTTTLYGITGAGNLAELYRIQALGSTWYDDAMWSLEAPWLQYFIQLSTPPHVVWDRVYLAFWAVIAFTSITLVAARAHRTHTYFCIALVISYFLTRLLAIFFPTAGPLFHHPELFQIDGTISDAARALLIRYMAGDVAQDGFLPGTMAMPSLHVGSTALAALVLATKWPRSLYLTIPITVVVWTSTIVLGWHYILDGVGGITVALVSYILASTLTNVTVPSPPSPSQCERT